MLRQVISILWPSFIAAGVGVGVIFTLVDPMELIVLGEHVHASRTTIYSIGFFVLWGIAAIASALSCFLMSNRHPGNKNLGGEDD
jgi:hypothetical protein